MVTTTAVLITLVGLAALAFGVHGLMSSETPPLTILAGFAGYFAVWFLSAWALGTKA
jgi:hypothetical protein